jgi:hypothetical protein
MKNYPTTNFSSSIHDVLSLNDTKSLIPSDKVLLQHIKTQRQSFVDRMNQTNAFKKKTS